MEKKDCPLFKLFVIAAASAFVVVRVYAGGAPFYGDPPDDRHPSEKPAFGVLAWRGMLRLAQEANRAPDEALIKQYRQLLAIARSDDDRTLVLSALGGCHHQDALALAAEQR